MDADDHKKHLDRVEAQRATKPVQTLQTFQHTCEICQRLMDEQMKKDERQGELKLDPTRP